MPLVAIHSSHLNRESSTKKKKEKTCLLRKAKDRVPGTALCQHISDEVLLAVVGGEDDYLGRRVALQPHVHEDGHRILCLSQVLMAHILIEIHASEPHLIEVWGGLALSHSIEVLDINELVVEGKPRVGQEVLWRLQHVGKVAQVPVAPAVEGAEGSSGPALSVQLHTGDAKAHKASKQGLLQVGVALKGHVLYDGRQLQVFGCEHLTQGIEFTWW